MRIAVLDVGGTAIKSGIVENGTLYHFSETATEAEKGGEHLLKTMISIIQDMELNTIDAIGISTTGQVDIERGTIFYANDNVPGYTGCEIGRRICDIFHVPVTVENDVNSAAIGEMYYGSATGRMDFLCLTYGTGIGGAIVLNGKVYEGAYWAAGSFGGILVHPEQIRQGEQLSGCYEKCASTSALVKRMIEVDSAIDNGRKIFDSLERPEVKMVVDQWIDEITYGLITLIHIFDVPLIILGGGIMSQKYVLSEVRKRTLQKVETNFRHMEIKGTGLGNTAGLLGIARLAEERFLYDNPK